MLGCMEDNNFLQVLGDFPPMNQSGIFGGVKPVQKIKYACGCEVMGYAPMPLDCPTHGGQMNGATLEKEVKKPTIRVSIILDESGSMISCASQTISGYNEYINGLKVGDKANYLITFSKFDSSPGDPTCRIQYVDKPLAEVPELTKETFIPRGGTPLYDAIGQTVSALKEGDGDVLVIILTDGGENSSKEYTANTVKTLIKQKEATGKWTFVYLGANQDAWMVAQQFGMHQGNTQSYHTGNMQAVMGNLVNATRSRASYSASGVGSTQCYFADAGISNVDADPASQPPVSNLSAAQVLGSAGGKARANALTPEQRKEIAEKAAQARWSQSPKSTT